MLSTQVVFLGQKIRDFSLTVYTHRGLAAPCFFWVLVDSIFFVDRRYDKSLETHIHTNGKVEVRTPITAFGLTILVFSWVELRLVKS
jgi:hypothetical protein